MVDGDWKTLCEGTAIGHKRIEKVTRLKVEKVRLRITQSVGPVSMRQFAVFAE